MDDWEESWLQHWSKAGSRGYELPKTGPAAEEAAFLTEFRTPEKEVARLERIHKAANRGAFEAGGTSYGLNILLPHEQAPNPYVQKTIDFDYFFARKVMLIKYSCAFVVMPGGLGTLDELFEAATLIQCRKIGPFPLVLMDAKFWKGLQIWGRYLVKHGVFEKWELGFGRVTDSPREAAELIIRSMPLELRNLLKTKKLA
jgi:uncharacterized protein (TIGR00730 family)